MIGMCLMFCQQKFSLEDLLQSSQYFSKFHCIRLKKDWEIVGKADMNNISNEL